jgi:sigma-B regulation protein RsbU (phosphoserine phosphatase)
VSDSTKRLPLIWIVDDSPTEAAITKTSLGADFHFEYFSDGAIVVERLSAAPRLPDLLLLDWVMPGMTGDQVCRFLRTQPRTKELPIIVVTASRIETDDIVAGLALGANDYVPRPFAPEELRARVDAALRTKQLADLAKHERQRLATVNHLGQTLFKSSRSVEHMVGELARVLSVSICDGCAVLLLPGSAPAMSVSHHRREPSGESLARIAALADPAIHSFASVAEARAKLPPAYAEYIARFGLHGLAILPFPLTEPLRGVVTVTRDGESQPFDADDIATIETCIEYTSLAIERALRFDAERIARVQLDTVLASLPVGLVAADPSGVLTLVNSAAVQLIPEVTAAKTLRDVLGLACWAASDGSPIVESLLGADEVMRPVTVDLLLRPMDEHQPTRTIAVSIVPLRDQASLASGVVTVFEDVSAQRVIDAERERISKFQEEMLGIVGHDLRNPLGAILTATELLKTSSLSSTNHAKMLRQIDSSAVRMTRIIDQLLDVTRTRLGAGISVVPQDSSLLSIVNGVLEELALAYPKTKFEVTTTDDVRGSWDPDRLGQVISNLASNAAQYGRPGDPVSLSIEHTESNVVIRVRNTLRDAPISPEMLSVLFEPYRRGKTEGHKTGLGLGLYIVRAIVRAHRGTIDVQSTEAGTVFRVVLPIGPTRSGDSRPS